MPNLNLKGDAPDELPEMSDAPESEPMRSGSDGSFRRMLPIAAGVIVALLLAAYILNRVGIVHLWGPKKASSVMVSEPLDSAQQTVSDSAMAEQFRKDSIEAVAAVAASKKSPAKQARMKEAGQKKTAEAAKAPAKKTEGTPEKKAEVKSPAQAEGRNMTTVEVPGAPRRRTVPQTEDMYSPKHRAGTQQQDRAAATGGAAQAPSKTQAERQTPKGVSAQPEASAIPKGSGKYSVQISSWLSASKARAFAERFTQAGVPAFVVVEGRLHRVCTGRFATRAAAEKRAEELVPMLESKYDIIILK